MADITVITLNIHSLKNKHKYIVHLVRKNKPDFIFLQETNINTHFLAQRYTTEMGFKNSTFSLGTYARGVAIIQTSDKFTVTHQYTDNQGRIAIVRVEDNNSKYTLVNIYAPARDNEKPAFFDKLENILYTTYKDETLILGGDFNYTEDDLDRPLTRNKNVQHSNFLDNTLRLFHLVDAYRTKYRRGQDTTFERKTYQATSRLDRFYIPMEETVAKVAHLRETLEYTDHKAVVVTLTPASGSAERHRGSPHWKFNNSLLRSEFYTNTIKTLLENTIDSTTTETQIDTGELWTLLKRTIKHLTQIIAN